MAKKSVIYRNIKREKLVAKYANKRASLKKILADPNTSEEEFYAAQAKLAKLPKILLRPSSKQMYINWKASCYN